MEVPVVFYLIGFFSNSVHFLWGESVYIQKVKEDSNANLRVLKVTYSSGKSERELWELEKSRQAS